MGYHLTIIRSSNGKLEIIGLQEARSAAEKSGLWKFEQNPPGFSLETANGVSRLFFSHGELWVKSPEPWEIDFLVKLANDLGARVRGDEYETYLSRIETYLHPDDKELKEIDVLESSKLLEKGYKSQNRIRNTIIGFFIVLGLVGFTIGKFFEK